MQSAIGTIARRLPRPLKSLLREFRSLSGHLLFAIVRPYFAIARAWRRRAVPVLAETGEPVILFLAPEAGLTPFFAAHAVLAGAAVDAGHAAIMLSCDGILPACSWKFAARVKPGTPGDRRNAACRSCRRDALVHGKAFGLVDISIESLLGSEERRRIAAIMAENSAALWGTTHDGIAFGEAALGEALRDGGKLELAEFSAVDHALLKATLYSALAIYFAVKAFSERYRLKRVAFYGSYSYWIPTLAFAQKRGIGVTAFEHLYNRDIDRRAILLRQRGSHEDLLAKIDCWPQYRDRALDAATVAEIAASSLFRLVGHGGISTHSPNWVRCDQSPLAALGLAPARRTIVAYSSSADEYLGGQHILKACGLSYPDSPRPFADNAEWLLALIDWVAGRLDLQLVIRLHPRLKGGRGRPASSEYARLRHLLGTVPANVAVVWPEDKVSSYNLAEIADAVAVTWSTLGLELARFGAPVIAAFRGVGSFPTGSFIAFEATRERYFATLEASLGAAASLYAITEAFRWTYFQFLSSSVDVSDLVPSSDHEGMPRLGRPRNHETIVQVLADGVDLSLLNMARLPAGAGVEAIERKAIVEAVTRFIAKLVCGEDVPGQSPRAMQAHQDRSVSLELRGRTYRRASPMAHRMALMLEHAAAMDLAG